MKREKEGRNGGLRQHNVSTFSLADTSFSALLSKSPFSPTHRIHPSGAYWSETEVSFARLCMAIYQSSKVATALNRRPRLTLRSGRL